MESQESSILKDWIKEEESVKHSGNRGWKAASSPFEQVWALSNRMDHWIISLGSERMEDSWWYVVVCVCKGV